MRLRTATRTKLMSRAMGAAAALTLMAGCSTYVPHEPATIEDGAKVYNETDALPYYDTGYQVSPGDTIEVTYHIDTEIKDRYDIAIGDQIRIEFYYYPQLDRTLNVRPDGRITVPYKGDVMAVGLTPEELSEKLNEVYSDFLTYNNATVSLIRYGAKIRELKEAIRTAPRGQSRSALVGPDGKISLPLLQGLRIAGLTVDQAAQKINEVYATKVQGMFTSAALIEATGNRVYVFGAVNDPGFYQFNGPTTVLQAVGLAGGFSSYAETSSTLLISRDEFNRPVGRLVDLAQILSSGNAGTDKFVKQSDVVFVPTSKLGRAALVGSAIRQMIPVNLSFSYAIDDTVDIVGPN